MADERPWRLFLALPLPAEAAAAVVRALAPVRASFPDARWLTVETLHLTLVFLGSTRPGRVADLARLVDAAAASHARFTVMTGLGGGREQPDGDGVAWLQLQRGGAETARLGARLEGEVAAVPGTGGGAARAPRRSPSAHLTVARHASRELIAALARGEPHVEPVTWVADRIVLFRSHLERSGAQYELMHVASLGG